MGPGQTLLEAVMIRLALKVLVGLVLSLTLAALLNHLGGGRQRAGAWTHFSTDRLALLGQR